jgi:hypothetical protein
VGVNAAVSHLSASAIQADALRAALRNPPLPATPKPERRERTHVLRLLRRLRPALA